MQSTKIFKLTVGLQIASISDLFLIVLDATAGEVQAMPVCFFAGMVDPRGDPFG
jgi:hypothetical protein